MGKFIRRFSTNGQHLREISFILKKKHNIINIPFTIVIIIIMIIVKLGGFVFNY